MCRPSFCLDVRFNLSKFTSQLGKGEIAGVFLPACNFTDALLLSLISLRFVGKGLTRTGLFLTVPPVMRPCDGTSGLVRGNRRKAVFAYKGCFQGLFSRGICCVSASDTRCYLSFPVVREKPEISEHARIFTNKTAGRGCP